MSTSAPSTAASAAAPLGAPPPVTQTSVRMWRRVGRTPLGLLGLAVLVTYVIAVSLGPIIASADPTATTAEAFLPIGSPGHLLGTDELGHDLLARYLHGGRPLIIVAFASCAIASLIGTIIGLAAGYWRGGVDQWVMRSMDVLLALPVVLLAVLLVSALGPGVGNLVVAISVSQIPYMARFVRHLAAREARRDYVRSARALGIGSPRIMFGEILPNISGPVLVQATAVLAVSAGFASGLTFLGLGLPPSSADWGYMVRNGEQFIYTEPMLALIPALLITGFVLAVNFVGDDLRDAVDPRELR